MPLQHYASRADAGDSPSPIFDGMKAVGLELIAARGATDGIAIDYIERPPDNQ
jgi:hypothetical protein